MQSKFMQSRAKTKWACIAVMVFCISPFSAQADDAGAAMLGGLFGGLVGSMIGSQAKPAPRTVVVSERVMNIQKALAFFGFFKGSIDGVSGSGTRRAIRDYLKAMNLPAGDDLNDDQYASLMKVYADKARLASGQPAAPSQPSQPNQPPPANPGPNDAISAVYKAIESPSAQQASTEVNAGERLDNNVAHVQLRDVCVLSLPVRAASDSDTQFGIKKTVMCDFRCCFDANKRGDGSPRFWRWPSVYR